MKRSAGLSAVVKVCESRLGWLGSAAKKRGHVFYVPFLLLADTEKGRKGVSGHERTDPKLTFPASAVMPTKIISCPVRSNARSL